MSKFVVFRGRDSQYYFTLKAPNGERIFISEGYVSKAGALKGVAAVRQYAPFARLEEDV